MDHADHFPDSVDVEAWLKVKDRLSQGIALLNSLSLTPGLSAPNHLSTDELEDLWHQEIMNTDRMVESICDAWLSGESIADSDPRLLWFFRSRFDPALDFVENMAWTRGHLSGQPEWTGFVPFPKMSENEVLRVLLGSWWKFRGSIRLIDDQIALRRAYGKGVQDTLGCRG